MSLLFVRDSLYKYLNDNLNIPITYNIGNSELSDIVDITVNGTITAGTKIFTLHQLGYTFKTAEVLIGRELLFGAESDTIKSWNNTTSTIELDTGFSNDILVGDSLTIVANQLIYMNMPYSISNNSTRMYNREEIPRFDLYVKVKNDNSKTKIYNILQSIRNLINGGVGKFTVYAADGTTVLGYARVRLPVSETNLMDTKDLQSYLLSFQVSYFMDYLK